MRWVDSHCHLDFPDFDTDRTDVIARARAAGVSCMVTIGTKLTQQAKVRKITEDFKDVFCSVGVHPHAVDSETEAGTERFQEDGLTEQLVALTAHPKVVAIGETGLDYHYAQSARVAQARSFRAHIAAARRTQLPVIVHTRDADADCLAILTEEYAKGPFPALIHCFTAQQALAKGVLQMGMMISVSGIVTFKKSEALRSVLDTVPLENLLVETDAPYLAPEPHRGQRNEPAFVVSTAQALARLKAIEMETLAQITTDNFLRLFTRVPAFQ